MSRHDSDPTLHARASENFPVASRLIAPRFRPFVHAFYRVARGADDVADSADLSGEAKLARLQAIDAVISGRSPAQASIPVEEDASRLRMLFIRHALDVEPVRQLLQAFSADAANRPCRSWSDLLAYCRFSAVPVGRFLLDLHAESAEAYRASDALCSALQVLNHLQDCRRDWIALRRCYVPTAWLDAEGLATADLAADATSPALRRVIDKVLDHVVPLIREAERLADSLADPGLAREAAGITALARSLEGRLRVEDPLRQRVAVGKLRKAMTFMFAAAAHRPRRHRARSSSFSVAMRLFPRRTRPAVAAIYALARRLDDIADGTAAPAERKRAALEAWRTEISAFDAGAPTDPFTIALHRVAPALPTREWLSLIDGLESDISRVRAPDDEALTLYCRRVAGTIGVLVLAACGHATPGDAHYAAALGDALQRVNILRDVGDDLEVGRVYLPACHLAASGIDPSLPADRIQGHPALARARAQFATTIVDSFALAEAAARDAPGARILAVRMIAAVYRRLYDRLRMAPIGARPSLGWRDQALAILMAIRRP